MRYSIYEKTAEIQRVHILHFWMFWLRHRFPRRRRKWRPDVRIYLFFTPWNWKVIYLFFYFLNNWQAHFTFITEKWQFSRTVSRARTWNRFLVCACLSVWWCRAVAVFSCAFSFRCIQMMCTEQRHEGIRLNSWVQSHSATPQRPQPEQTQHVINKPMRRVEQEEPAGSNQSSDFKSGCWRHSWSPRKPTMCDPDLQLDRQVMNVDT